MKKLVSSLALVFIMVSMANAGVVKTAYRGVKAAPKVVKSVAKAAYKVVV